jgi:hypothetical protein
MPLCETYRNLSSKVKTRTLWCTWTSHPSVTHTYRFTETPTQYARDPQVERKQTNGKAHACITASLQLKLLLEQSCFPRSNGNNLIHIQLASLGRSTVANASSRAHAIPAHASHASPLPPSPIPKIPPVPHCVLSSMAVVAGLPCFRLSVAAVPVRVASRPNRRRAPRWTGAAPSAGRGEMDSDDGDEALPRGRSVVVTTTPGAAKLSVKGT